MTGNLWLDWLLLALSLFNVIVLLWLGLTVLLNVDKRTGGVWLIGSAALLGSAFFAAHTAILSIASQTITESLDFWWELGWMPLLALPLIWYAIVLWYSGYSLQVDGHASPLRRRHRAALWVVGAAFVVMVATVLFAAPLPRFTQVLQLQFRYTASLFGVPWLFAVYPIYILICMALAYDAIRHPAPEVDAARRFSRAQARPWLLATTLTLLLVSVLVTAAIAWIGALPHPAVAAGDYPALAFGVGWFDLVISGLIAFGSVLVGQAVVHYELFSGRVLPRRELRRHWLNAVILAAGYGLVVGAALAYGIRPIYSLLLTALLMTIFYVLLGWRTFARQEELVQRLRPFVASTHLYEQLTTAPDRASRLPPEPAVESTQMSTQTFTALCADVLNTTYAALVATGPLGTLVTTPLLFPFAAAAPPALDWMHEFGPTSEFCVPVALPAAPAVAWVVPLRSERGMMGVLLLGTRRGGGLYTQEEIEIAHATGERLIDLRAGSELAQRLLTVQRERLTESVVLDRQARRMLHDDILPDLHTALLLVNQEDAAQTTEISRLLTSTHRRIAEVLRAAPVRPALRPGGNLLSELRQLVEEEMGSQFDAVQWQDDPHATEAAAALSPVAAEVIYYAVREAVRNAARHARGGQAGAPLTLTVTAQAGDGPQTAHAGDGLQIVVEDDGVGAAQTTSEQSRPSNGGGQGLALHSAMLAVIGGALIVDSAPGAYTRVRVCAPPQ